MTALTVVALVVGAAASFVFIVVALDGRRTNRQFKRW